MRCVGVSSSVAGYRADLLVLDDPIAKVEDVSSPAALDKQWDWWQADFLTRLKPNGKIVVIMTRWSRKDIAGRNAEQVKGKLFNQFGINECCKGIKIFINF